MTKAVLIAAFLAAIMTAEPKPVADKALNWKILAKAAQAQAIEGQIATLKAEQQRIQGEVQAALKEACEAEKIAADKCTPRVQGDQVFVEAAPEPKTEKK